MNITEHFNFDYLVFVGTSIHFNKKVICNKKKYLFES